MQVIRKGLILAAFWLCKLLGVFDLARRLTRSRLRVLCYHGFALDDEARFRESLFISRERFERRMRYLRNSGFRVLPLDEAHRRLRAGTLPHDAVAITIDDGFHSTHAVAKDILARHRFPATLYLTSYYFQKGTPVFQLAVDYICWKSPRSTVDLSGLGIAGLDGATAIAFGDDVRREVSRIVHAHGSALPDEAARVALSRRLAGRLGVDYDAIAQSRILSLVSPRELQELQASGMRIGLHTHRHRLPESQAEALRELADNRAAVEPVIGRRMTDFCYPSGVWSAGHRPALRRAGVETATTCESGLVDRHRDPYLLPRILDDSRVSMIEFEAELSGFCEVLRSVRARTHRNAVALWHACESLPGCVAPALSI
ncbi:MAG: polysaccharide deacetylase family protein [Novosphingobium sp.]|nr:polysaccharide deacetylase family protein [Novosphingobium sp.]